MSRYAYEYSTGLTMDMKHFLSVNLKMINSKIKLKKHGSVKISTAINAPPNINQN